MTRTVALPPYPPRPKSPAQLTERELQAAVLDLARLYAWTPYHAWLSKHSQPGWPDVALCRPPRLILAELKRQDGKLTQHQQRWIALLEQCPGVETFVWRPADLAGGAITEALR
jgi:hypothetical protein